MLCRRYMFRLEIDIKMHCKLIVLPLVLLISFSFAANVKKDEGASASENNISPAHTDDDEDLIPGVQQPDDDYEYEDGSDEIDAADQPAVKKGWRFKILNGLRVSYRFGAGGNSAPSGHFLYSFSSINAKKGKVIKVVPTVPKIYTVTVSIKPTSFVKGWTSVIHATTGGNVGRLGYRIPGIFFNYNRLHICGSVSGNTNYYVNSQPLPLNRWANVKIVNSKVGNAYWYTVYVNGKRLVHVRNTKPAVYKNVKVYVTDPWYAPFKGVIKNLRGIISAKPSNAASGSYYGSNWKLLDGRLMQTSVADGSIWGVTSAHAIFFRSGINAAHPHGTKWIRIPGALKYITVGDGKVMGVNRHDVIYYRTGISKAHPAGTGWGSIGGRLMQISVGDGKIMGVNSGHAIYFRTGVNKAHPYGTGWKHIPGGLKHISVGGGKIMGVNKYDQVWWRTGVSSADPAGTGWKIIGGRLKQIYVGGNRIMGVNSHNQIWIRTGINKAHPYGVGWRRLPGSLKYISAGYGKIMGANGHDQIFYRTAVKTYKGWRFKILNGLRVSYRFGAGGNSAPSGHFLYSFSSINAKKGKVIKVVPTVPKIYTVTVSIKPTSFVKGWTSVIHATTGGNVGRLGYRIPGIFFNYNRLHICGSVSGNTNYYVNSQPLPLNRWANVKIVNSKVGNAYWYTVYVNGKRLVHVRNTKPAVYKNVKVYVTDPWYAPFKGVIKNLRGIISAKPSNAASGSYYGSNWKLLDDGRLMQTSVADGSIWGVTSAHAIFFRSGINAAHPHGTKWVRIPGALKYITVGDGKVMGVNRHDVIYYRTGISKAHPAGTGWGSIGGRLMQISVGDGKIMGVNSGHAIYFRTGVNKAHPYGTGWKHIPGGLKHISVGGGKIMGVNKYDQVWWRTGVSSADPAGTGWKMIGGRLKQIYVGGNRIMGVNSHNQIWIRTGINKAHPYGVGWRRLPGSLKYISAGYGKIMGANGHDQIFYRTAVKTYKGSNISVIPAFPTLHNVNGYVPVKKGNLVRTLSAIPAEYVISFSVRPTAFSSGYSSVLHFTTGGNYGKFGYRIPGVWINNNKLHICGSVKGNLNYCYNSKSLAKNKWTDVTIVNSKVGSKYWYKVIVNGKLLGKVVNPSSRVYKNVKVYVTDPWYKPFRGSLRNIKISAPGLVYPVPCWLLLSCRYGGGRRRFFSRRFFSRHRRYGRGRRPSSSWLMG